MIVERFRNRDPGPVYRRFREQGRLAPEGLQYVSSWVDEKLEICFQLMEAALHKKSENPTHGSGWFIQIGFYMKTGW